MRRLVLWLLVAGALAACSAPRATATPTPSDATAQCRLEAARRAVQLELARYRGWLDNETDPARRQAFTAAIRHLEKLQANLAAATPATFDVAQTWQAVPGDMFPFDAGATRPEPITLDEAWLDAGDPPQVHFPQQSRSGPFYLVTATAVTPVPPAGEHHTMVLHPVMPQSYPFPAFYVCLAEVR